MNSLLRYATIVSLAVSVVACKKNNDAPRSAALSSQLLGEWSWLATQGGMTGNQVYTPASTGTTIRWVFRADSTFEEYVTQNGTAHPTVAGRFAIRTARSIHNGQQVPSLTLYRPNAQTFIIEQLGEKLVLDDNSYDGFGQTFGR